MSSFLFGIIYKVCTGAIHLPTDSVTYEQDDRLWCKAHRHKRYIAWPESESVLSWWILHNCITLCRVTTGIEEGAVIPIQTGQFLTGSQRNRQIKIKILCARHSSSPVRLYDFYDSILKKEVPGTFQTLVPSSCTKNFCHGSTALSGLGLQIVPFFEITLRHTTLGRTPLDEWSCRRRDLYLTTHNTRKVQPYMPKSEFEPAVPRKQAAADPTLRAGGNRDRLQELVLSDF